MKISFLTLIGTLLFSMTFYESVLSNSLNKKKKIDCNKIEQNCNMKALTELICNMRNVQQSISLISQLYDVVDDLTTTQEELTCSLELLCKEEDSKSDQGYNHLDWYEACSLEKERYEALLQSICEIAHSLKQKSLATAERIATLSAEANSFVQLEESMHEEMLSLFTGYECELDLEKLNKEAGNI